MKTIVTHKPIEREIITQFAHYKQEREWSLKEASLALEISKTVLFEILSRTISPSKIVLEKMTNFLRTNQRTNQRIT